MGAKEGVMIGRTNAQAVSNPIINASAHSDTFLEIKPSSSNGAIALSIAADSGSTIYWGDGTSDAITSVQGDVYVHEYIDSTQTYMVHIVASWLDFLQGSIQEATVYQIWFGSNVIFIDYRAFAGCSELAIINFAGGEYGSGTLIDSEVFDDCYNLQHVNGIIGFSADIGFYAFRNTALKGIVLSQHTGVIGSGAFENMSGYVVLCNAEPPTIGDSVFSYDTIFLVPTGSMWRYESDTNWSEYAGQFVEYGG